MRPLNVSGETEVLLNCYMVIYFSDRHARLRSPVSGVGESSGIDGWPSPISTLPTLP